MQNRLYSEYTIFCSFLTSKYHLVLKILILIGLKCYIYSDAYEYK